MKRHVRRAEGAARSETVPPSRAALPVFALWIGGTAAYVLARWVRGDAWEPYLSREYIHSLLWVLGANAVVLAALLGATWREPLALRRFVALGIGASVGLWFGLPVALWWANARFDHSPPVAHDVVISGRWYERSRPFYRNYVSFAPVVPDGANKVDLEWPVYRTLSVGDRARVVLRAGALGWTWVDAVERVGKRAAAGR